MFTLHRHVCSTLTITTERPFTIITKTYCWPLSTWQHVPVSNHYYYSHHRIYHHILQCLDTAAIVHHFICKWPHQTDETLNFLWTVITLIMTTGSPFTECMWCVQEQKRHFADVVEARRARNESSNVNKAAEQEVSVTSNAEVTTSATPRPLTQIKKTYTTCMANSADKARLKMPTLFMQPACGSHVTSFSTTTVLFVKSALHHISSPIQSAV